MDNDKLLTIIFIILGSASGFLSNYFLSIFPIWGAVTSFAIFFVAFFLLIKIFPIKKFKRGLLEHFITFSLVWLVIWILLFNIGGTVVG